MEPDNLFKFYNDEINKYERAKILKDYRCSLKNNSLDINQILKNTIDLTAEFSVLSHFHYRLLRLVLKKSKCQHMKSTWISMMIEVSLDSIENVSLINSVVVQREYLKFVCFVIKDYGKLVKQVIEKVIRWFSKNLWTLLEKYFLKIFNGMAAQKLLDESKYRTVISSLDQKGYINVLLRSNKDFFIDLMTLNVTPQLQSQALELGLNIFYTLLCDGQTDVAFEVCFQRIQPDSMDVELARGYIKSILSEDDTLFLSNLLVAAMISKRLSCGDMKNKAGYEQLVELFNIQYWLHHFIIHIKFDHKLVMDWLLDGNQCCKSYLLHVLPVISANFLQFIEFLCTMTPGESDTAIENVMDFLIRLNLSVHEFDQDIGSLIDEIEEKFECYGEVSMPDPLSGILSSNFSSQCSIDESDHKKGKDDSSGLVAYSDSD